MLYTFLAKEIASNIRIHLLHMTVSYDCHNDKQHVSIFERTPSQVNNMSNISYHACLQLSTFQDVTHESNLAKEEFLVM